MGDKDIEKKSTSDLYQDIVNLGGLNKAINEALRSVGSNLEADDNVEWTLSYSRVEYKERSSQIMLAANERRFSVDLWSDGIQYGNWWFEDLIQVADFIKYFVELKYMVKEMKKIYTWFHTDKGKLHEKGAKKETEQRWKDIVIQLEKEETVMKYLLPYVKVAKEFAELAILFPYTSMNTLCFSLTTGFPYLPVGPKITGWKEYIEVEIGENDSRKIYSMKELKKYMKQNIVYYGSARQGTADSIICSQANESKRC